MRLLVEGHAIPWFARFLYTSPWSLPECRRPSPHLHAYCPSPKNTVGRVGSASGPGCYPGKHVRGHKRTPPPPPSTLLGSRLARVVGRRSSETRARRPRSGTARAREGMAGEGGYRAMNADHGGSARRGASEQLFGTPCYVKVVQWFGGGGTECCSTGSLRVCVCRGGYVLCGA